MRKNTIVGLLCLAMFFAAYVGSIVVIVPHMVPFVQGPLGKASQPSGDEGGSRKPFAILCGDEGGPGRPYSNQTGT
jgi:hypothetical protein